MGKQRRPWFRRLHCPATQRNPSLMRTIAVGAGVNAVGLLERAGRRVALVGCGDGSLRRYDLSTGRLLEPILTGHTGSVYAVALSGDGRHALSGSDDDTLRWWDLEGGRCRRTLAGHTGSVEAVALSGDGRHALSGSSDDTLGWWDLEGGRCLSTLDGHTHWVRAVALAADG